MQRLLGFARRQALDTRGVDIAGLLGGIRELIGSSVGSNIEVRIESPHDLPAALADLNQLELAILNLCVNARDAMPDGGVIVIGAEARAISSDSEIPGLQPGGYVRLWVRDSGQGMDAETLARAVEPFFSTKPIGQGTGLGLSMVHGLVAQLGGAFTLVSAPAKGTTASLFLPIADAVSPVADDEVTVADTIERPLSILLVDDEDIVRTGTAEMLRDLGHSVTEALGGAEALDRVKGGLAFDLLVTDYKMPRMNGAELARQMRVIRPDTPILLITGYTGIEEEAPDLMRLTKPFRQADLADALLRLPA